MSYLNKTSADCDEVTTVNDTKFKGRVKKPKLNEVLSMMHCQAKIIEENMF